MSARPSNSVILVPLLKPKFATALAARCVRTSGSGHWRSARGEPPHAAARLPRTTNARIAPLRVGRMAHYILSMIYIDLAVVTALILLNGLLALAELAVVSSRRSRLQVLADRGITGSRRALALASDPGRFLSTVQIGITLVGVLSGAFSGATLGARLAEPPTKTSSEDGRRGRACERK
jgi:hypothetical protein